LWSGHPLSNYSICEQTWIDGKQYFSVKNDQYFRQRDQKLRNDLVQKILSSEDSGSSEMSPDSEDANKFHSCSADHNHLDAGGEQ